MVEKMRYINAMGNVNDIDIFIEQYVEGINVHFEDAIKELVNEKGLTSIKSQNPYFDIFEKGKKICKRCGVDGSTNVDIPKEEAISIIEEAYLYTEKVSDELSELKSKKEDYKNIIDMFEPFSKLTVDIKDVMNFEFIEYQFGKMPITSYRQFEAFLYDDPNILFELGYNDKEFQYGVYFTPMFMKNKIEPIFSSLHFQRIDIKKEYDGQIFYGTPMDIVNEFKEKLKNIESVIMECEQTKLNEAFNSSDTNFDRRKICMSFCKIKNLFNSYDVRKYAAKTENNFFIFVGWMKEKDAVRLHDKITRDDRFVFILEDESSSIVSTPPIKLKNKYFVRPFEFFTKMYGLPTYGEIDPTFFIAITYTILFGIMFADVGQGFVLSLLGVFLYKIKKIKLGSILAIIGVSSTFFGLMFGSVFGFEFEGILKLSVAESAMTFLIGAVVIGIFMIIVAMLFNLANAIKQKNVKSILFDPNGISGLTFYISLIAIIYLSFIKKVIIPKPIIVALLAVPILFIMFKEPLNNRIEGKSKNHKMSLGLFIFESIIEVFEVLLGYFTNTVSFVRVGAFVLSHASMMSVVMMLSKTPSGSHNLVIVALGNILVMGLEGLIVGIQVLRIEFYEMFSRFYKGTGRAFKSYDSSIE